MTTPDAPESLPASYFDAVYAADPDPWRFETSDYERAKYAATVAALPRERYGRGFEIGCSIGVLTASLAPRCDQLLSVDVSESALARARDRLAGSPHVRFERLAVPDDFPEAHFDLIVLSEVGYYWSRPDLQRASDRIVDALEPDASLLLVHWTPPVHDYPLTGDDVHEHFLQRCGEGRPLRHLQGRREPSYRLDLFSRVDAVSAA